MRKIIIILQDIDCDGEYLSSRISEYYNKELNSNHVFALAAKAEKDLDKLLIQKEFQTANKAS